VFGILGIFYNPMLIIIAVFILLAASGEAAQAQLGAVAQGALASDAMIREFQTLGTGATVNGAAEALIRTTQTDFRSSTGRGGCAARSPATAMVKALQERGPETPVLEVMQADIPTVSARAKLDKALRLLMQRGSPVVGVTGPEDRLIGLLTIENLGAMMLVQSTRPGVAARPWGNLRC
jgi:hypothetical protein